MRASFAGVLGWTASGSLRRSVQDEDSGWNFEI
jgi:hypothetical protein